MTPADPKTKKIFIVDSDQRQAKMLVQMLRQEGFQVMTALSGEEFIANAESSNSDLFIVDLLMVGMGGIEIVRHLQSEGLGSIPVIVLSERKADKKSGNDQMVRMEPNVVDFMEKPVHLGMFTLRVHQILDTDPSANRQSPQT